MILNLLFYGFASLALISAFLVIFSKRMVYNVLALILVFLATAGTFILMHAAFLGIVLVVLYVGAVAVFFLFTVMMFGSQVETKTPISKSFLTSAWALGLAFWLVLLSFVFCALCYNGWFVPLAPETTALGLKKMATAIYTIYFVPFQLLGLTLLVAIFGAISLTLTHQKGVKRQNSFSQNATTASARLKQVFINIKQGLKDV